MAKNIDITRGCHITRHADTGMYIYMYLDTPGVYLNTFGKEVPETLAAEAGFEVDKYRKMRIRNERMAAAKEAIETELALQYEAKPEIIEGKAGELHVELIGKTSAFVIDEDGNRLNDMPIDKKKAVDLYKKLVKVGPVPKA